MIASLWMIIGLIALLVWGVPVAMALGVVGIVGILANNPAYLLGVGHAVWNTVDNYVLLSVPLFVLMGELFQRSNLAMKFYRAACLWISWLPGGLLHSNILACSVFAAVSGSSVATAATIGSIAIPEMERQGYTRRKVLGSLAAGGTLGILIPPSIPMILYGAIVEASVGKLFMAGIFPGILLTLAFVIYIFFSNLRAGSYPKGDPFDLGAALQSVGDLIPLAVLIVIVLGSIYLGIATATEAAAVGVLGTLGLTVYYRSFSWAMLLESVKSTTRFTAVILFIVIGAQIFSYSMFNWGATDEIKDWVATLNAGPLVIVGGVLFVYLILGMFVDAISMMVLTLAFTHPLVLASGYDTIWFGVVLVITLEIGLITPPVGLNLFTIQSVAAKGVKVSEIAAGAFPYVLIMIGALALFTIFPQIITWPI
ncbi:MAG: TRAP transporter large permease subunit [Alphaproteobacteria bacterium]